MIRVAAAAVLIGVLAAACSSAGLPMAEYAPTVETLAAAHQGEMDRLNLRHLTELDAAIAELQRTVEGEALAAVAVDETARRSVDLFASIGDSVDLYIQDLQAIDPPAQVSLEHEAFIAALASSRSGITPILDALPSATSFEEIARVIAASGFADSQLRVESACTALERSIGQHAMEVDLRCTTER